MIQPKDGTLASVKGGKKKKPNKKPNRTSSQELAEMRVRNSIPKISFPKFL